MKVRFSARQTAFKLIPEVGTAIGNSSGVQQFTAMKAKLLMFYARRIFLSKVKHTHPVTPPPYAESFFMRKAASLTREKLTGYIVGNRDPAAIMVEFGAHPRGGPTLVLRYHPLSEAIDTLASSGGQ